MLYVCKKDNIDTGDMNSKQLGQTGKTPVCH